MFLLPRDSWEIKSTAKKGKGIFATKAIAAGTIIGDYIGKVIRTAEEETIETDDGLYLMYYHERASLYPMDIHAPGIHLINHSCTPNIWMHTYRGHTLFFALRHIFAGEEVTVSYLLSPNECDNCTHVCRCESVFCTGSMHLSQKRYDAWNDFSDAESKATKRMRITYGKALPKLDSYPKTVPDNAIYDLFGSLAKPSLTLKNKSLPSISELRKQIRRTGKTLYFPKLKLRILGIQDNVPLSEPISS